MKPIVAAILMLSLSLSTSSSEAQDKPATPIQQYSALMKEYGPASGALRKASTDLERKSAVERLAGFSSKFIDLAEKYPDDPVALTALRQAVQAVGSTDSAAQITWEINRSDFPAGNTDDSVERTVALVLRDHVLSNKLGPVIDRMRYGYRLEYEECLSAVLEKNPHREVQALTCLVLAQYLQDKLRMIRLAEDRPELAECYEIVFGKHFLPALQRLGQTGLATRIESLFERAAKEYADVKFRSGTIGETAKSELYDIRHLGVGKVGPDIAGKDQDGKQFKLSDYRGNVVLLYFWSEY
jgi:hypothetical protein